MAANHEPPWPPEHATHERGRPNFVAAWVRAVQRRMLADGDLPSDVTGKRPVVAAWDGRGQEASRTCGSGGCDAMCGRGVFLRGGSHCRLCEDEGAYMPDLESMAHSLRVARRFCPLFQNIRDDAPRKWKHSSVPVSSRLRGQPLLAPFHLTRLSEVVEEGFHHSFAWRAGRANFSCTRPYPPWVATLGLPSGGHGVFCAASACPTSSPITTSWSGIPLQSRQNAKTP